MLSSRIHPSASLLEARTGRCAARPVVAVLPTAPDTHAAAHCSAAAPCQQHARTAIGSSTITSVATASVEDAQALWSPQAFRTYLQAALGRLDPLHKGGSSGVVAAAAAEFSLDDGDHLLWKMIRREAKREAAFEPLLSSFLYASILAHDCFERSLAFVLAARLQNSILLSSQLYDTFYEVLSSSPDVCDAALADIVACKQRDPACLSASVALLYYKGYHALQTHRIAHTLYSRGHKVMALALQNTLSEALGVDIHPGARMGYGIFLDHACGVVIGETAVIGNNVTIMQDVTLGGTGKEGGDRHPKVADNVLIGAQSTVLGNISIGQGALIAPGSLVLKAVQPYAMVAGSPAKQVGQRPASYDSADEI